MGFGWHRDESHPDLGECHFQIDYAGRTVERQSARFLDEHPLEVLETRLAQLRTILPQIRWTDGEPAMPESGL